MTIRAKLYAAMAMTVLGPLVTIAVAFAAFNSLSDRFDEVSERSERQALALEIKYAVTDVNGWQTAYGYDDGASRPQFERSAANVRRLLAVGASGDDRDARARSCSRRCAPPSGASWRSTSSPTTRCRRGRRRASSASSSGPRSATSRTMARAAAQLAAEEERRTKQVQRSFDKRLTDAKKALVIVGLGAGVIIILLLLTTWDIARLALERQAGRDP